MFQVGIDYIRPMQYKQNKLKVYQKIIKWHKSASIPNDDDLLSVDPLETNLSNLFYQNRNIVFQVILINK